MRLLLTALHVADERRADLAVECEDDATVADVARRLAERLGLAPVPQTTRQVAHLGLVRDLPAAGQPLEALPPPRAPDLWIGDHLLDPLQRVSASELRHGMLVGVGGPVPAVLAEPDGTVEVRVASGPGSGVVHRLSPGDYLVGSGADCEIRLEDPSLPEVLARVEVDLSGDVRVQATEEVADESIPAPERRAPLTGPIVVSEREAPAPEPKKRRRRRLRRGRRKKSDDALAEVATPHRSVDPADDRALVEIDRTRVPAEGTTWTPGDAMTIGTVMLELAVPRPPDASLSPSPGGATLDYNRPPRLLPAPRKTEFSLPRVPVKPEKMPMPFLMVIAPIFMGGMMYTMTRSPYTLMFVAMSPLMMIANFSQGRTSQKSRYKRQLVEHKERELAIQEEAHAALVTERTARRRDFPDPGEVLLFATGPRARLWERRRGHPDWMEARVGTADRASEVQLRDPARESHQGPLTWTAPDVPVTLPLVRLGVVGLAGEGSMPRRMARWVVAQVATLHSPADVQVVVLVAHGEEAGTEESAAGPAARAEAEWQWVRWLPHLRAGAESATLARVGADDASTSQRIMELLALLEQRRVHAEKGAEPESFDPVLVVLDGARELRLRNGMITLLRQGPEHGIVFCCLDADARLLPEECRAVVSTDPTDPTGLTQRVDVTGQGSTDGVRPDVVSTAWCERVSRALSPVKDVSEVGAASTVPTSSRLLEVIRLDPPTPEKVAAIWQRGGRTTAAVIGERASGPFELDIRRDGPHGLVAGTTGSGKSELLQTIIASLAVGNRPDEMTYVLVDYKGGAAFKDCKDLPHTVGMVTDLDGHLTGRALDSLGAELRRREHQLAGAGAKDIEDYLALRAPNAVGAEAATAEPMPRLLIVIDEFAALVSELPDFVTGLVDIARRGRSLGVHLILATQRPAGVVSAEIKSNTNLRIALRVTDVSDSEDVIDAKDAAQIAQSTPGRALARLGHSSLVTFQSSRVGGRPRGADEAAEVGLREVSWSALGAAPPAKGGGEEEDDINVPTDLKALVTAINAASEAMGVHSPPSPWLPPLQDIVVLDDLWGESHQAGQPPVAGRVVPLPLGMADYPRLQRQDPITWDLEKGGHLAFTGQPRSGRSSALRLVAGGVADALSPLDVHLYGIDCGNNALLPLVALPHTGAVVTRDQPDRVRRLVDLLNREVGRRQQLLAEQGYADLSEQRRAVERDGRPDDRLPYFVVLIDRWEGLVAAFESVDSGVIIEQLSLLMREGAGVGLRFVLSGDRSLLTGRMSTLVEDRVVLRLPAAEDYSLIGMRPKDVPLSMPEGRAFRAEGAVEMQVALLDEDPSGTAQVAALQRLARQAKESTGRVPEERRPARVDELPSTITYVASRALSERRLERSTLVVGVGGDTLGLRTHDVLEDGPGFLVVGPPRSGRSTALVNMVVDATARGWQAVLLTPRRSPLKDLARTRGVKAVYDDTVSVEDLRQALATKRAPRIVVVDDYEILGADHLLVPVLEDYLKEVRDTVDALVIGAGIDEVQQYYRGPTAMMRRSRTGLIMAPRSALGR